MVSLCSLTRFDKVLNWKYNLNNATCDDRFRLFCQCVFSLPGESTKRMHFPSKRPGLLGRTFLFRILDSFKIRSRYGRCRNRPWKGKSMREVDSRTLTRLCRCRRLSAVSVGRGTLKPDSFRDRNSVLFQGNEKHKTVTHSRATVLCS